MTGQSELFDTTEYDATADFDQDDWETPDAEARAMVDIIAPFGQPLRLLEPTAGSGQIVRQIVNSSLRVERLDAFEPNKARYDKGQEEFYLTSDWSCTDFLGVSPRGRSYDHILANPPFSIGLEIMAHSIKMLTPKYGSFMLFLLPNGYFQSVDRYEQWMDTLSKSARIQGVYQFVNRIHFLMNGIPYKQTQQYHTVYRICHLDDPCNNVGTHFIHAGSYRGKYRRIRGGK